MRRRRATPLLSGRVAVLALGRLDGVADDDRRREQHAPGDQRDRDEGRHGGAELSGQGDEEGDHGDDDERVAGAAGEAGQALGGGPPASHDVAVVDGPGHGGAS